ncbi:hypothetical protein Ait01nite_031990 [Actinoplanes italicus]|nr:hypothetical protein Ait01nite_031990 [Actinoplanes italicus]
MICDRPTPDGYADPGCRDRARRHLDGILELLDPARAIAHRHTAGGSDGAGVPGPSMPLNLGAGARLDAVQNALTTSARDIAEERGVTVPGEGDPIVLAVWFLAEYLEWARHRAEVGKLYGDIEDCVRAMRDITAGPPERKYLGPCGAVELTPEPWEPGMPASTECDGDVYIRVGADVGRCRTCKTEYAERDRREWLDGLTADLAAPARDIAHALGVPVKTIRTWATEFRSESGRVLRPAKLRTYWRQGEHVTPWAERTDGATDQQWRDETARRGPRLHYVGDVRQLALDAANRRAAREAAEMGA